MHMQAALRLELETLCHALLKSERERALRGRVQLAGRRFTQAEAAAISHAQTILLQREKQKQ